MKIRSSCAGLAVILGILMCSQALAQDAVLGKKINEAIDKGIVYVKKFSDDGDRGSKRPATWSLRGWALLEAGVPADDPVIKSQADYVRQEVASMDKVYDVALALLFLDKLADPGDEPLIESLAVRLIAGQSNRGGWTYHLGTPKDEERARLKKVVEEADKIRKEGLPIKLTIRSPKEAAKEFQRQLKAIDRIYPGFGGDNSNTQFAMIACWVARRHGVPVQNCLEQVEKRFKTTQTKTGQWSYDLPDKGPPVDDNEYAYPAMTCAGLLGLALGEGVRDEPRDLLKDKQVQFGLEVLGKALTEDAPAKRSNYHYFLFSMERAAVVYNIKNIGAQDWYLWGARKLVETQGADGSWASFFGRDAADTCMALLFLKRANVAKDLTEILEAPIRKGPGNKRPPPPKLPDNLFDPPKIGPKEAPKDQSKDKAPKQSRVDGQDIDNGVAEFARIRGSIASRDRPEFLRIRLQRSARPANRPFIPGESSKGTIPFPNQNL
jgi:hypothetical protein